jgi:hypothetical protein
VALIASTYRSEPFLQAWLANVAAQTIWPQAELVVIANDPRPAESALLDAFCAAHPQAKVFAVERESLYRSWNRAIEASHAPLLALSNVDDLRTPDGLEAQVAALEADAHAAFAYGPYHSVATFPSDPVAVGRTLVDPPVFDREEFTRSMHAGPFFAWRRRPEPELRLFDEQLRVVGDMDLVVRLAFNGAGIRVATHLGAYYDAGTGLSTGAGLQPLEAAMLLQRYGIYDKLDYRFVAHAAAEYDLRNLYLQGVTARVADVVPEYDALLSDRRARWLEDGLDRFARQQLRRRLGERVRRWRR